MHWAAAGLAIALVGCTRPSAATVAPSEEELLVLPELERVVPVRVGVEGRGEEPRLVLVPKYEVPELTPEEKEALGIREPGINFLEFYQPPRLGVWPETGGVDTYQAGLGGVAAGTTGFEPVSAMWPATGGAGVGTLPEGVRRSGRSGWAEGVSGQAGVAGVRVGEPGPARVGPRAARGALLGPSGSGNGDPPTISGSDQNPPPRRAGSCRAALGCTGSALLPSAKSSAS